MEPEESDTPMREVVFHVLADCPGHLAARAERPPITIAAPSFEELQHEAREALIQHLGPAHAAYRVRLQRHPSAPITRQRRLLGPGMAAPQASEAICLP
jgi:regulator of sirC expression with transglutaminase-like and TPR domain